MIWSSTSKLWVIVGEGEVTGWRAGEDGLHGRFEGVGLEEGP